MFKRIPSIAFALLTAILLSAIHMLAAPPAGQAQTAVAGQLLISEFRLRGPGGASDECRSSSHIVGSSCGGRRHRHQDVPNNRNSIHTTLFSNDSRHDSRTATFTT